MRERNMGCRVSSATWGVTRIRALECTRVHNPRKHEGGVNGEGSTPRCDANVGVWVGLEASVAVEALPSLLAKELASCALRNRAVDEGEQVDVSTKFRRLNSGLYSRG